jgi:Eco57I restriction-modification methylase
VVIGNPPYVRMEFLKEVKPYLEEHYRVAADRADLYAYFFERGVGLLKPGGRLGYISSSTFFRTGSGEKLRTLLADETAIETVIDFGDEQIFEGVTTYPAILTLRKPARGERSEGALRFLKLDGPMPKELSGIFDAAAAAMPRSRLNRGLMAIRGGCARPASRQDRDGQENAG